MPLAIECQNPQCRKKLRVADDMAGKKVLCPACRQMLVVSPPAVPNTMRILLTVHYLDKQFSVELDFAVNSRIEEILRACLQQLALAYDSSESWQVTFRGKPLVLGRSLEEEIPGIDGLDSVALEVWSTPDLLPAAQKQMRPSAPSYMAPESKDVDANKVAALDADGDELALCDEGSLSQDFLMEEEAPAKRRVTRRDDDREESAPSVAKGRRETVQRKATVRYFSRMNPRKMFPLRVILSRRAIQKVVKKAVAQVSSAGFEVAMGSVIEVEPILAGCACYPPVDTVRVQPGEVEAVFWVVPQVLGQIMHARVVLRQDQQELAVIPLSIKVVNQTLTVIIGALGFLMPVANVLLKHFGIDLQAHQSGIVAKLMDWLFASMSPELLALPFLLGAVGMYLWMRPRARDVFWDLDAQGPAEQLEQARQAFKSDEPDAALEILADLRERFRRYQPAWLLAGEIHYHQKEFDKALECYEQGLALGKGKGPHYSRAALAASRTGDNVQAYAILKQALDCLAPTEVTPVIHYNLGCYAARLGKLDEAMDNLHRAAEAGYQNSDQLRNDPDLIPLRARSDFGKLLALLD